MNFNPKSARQLTRAAFIAIGPDVKPAAAALEWIKKYHNATPKTYLVTQYLAILRKSKGQRDSFRAVSGQTPVEPGAIAVVDMVRMAALAAKFGQEDFRRLVEDVAGLAEKYGTALLFQVADLLTAKGK